MKALVLVLLAACYPSFHTTHQTTARVVGPPEVDPPRAVVLHAKVYDGIIVVTAGRPRTCRRAVEDTVETRTEGDAVMVGTRGGEQWGYALVPLLIAAWPVGLADVGISVGVAAAGGSTHAESHAAGTVEAPCAQRVSGITVHVTLSSGRRVDGTTDVHGEFALLLPSDEPTGPLVLQSDAAR